MRRAPVLPLGLARMGTHDYHDKSSRTGGNGQLGGLALGFRKPVKNPVKVRNATQACWLDYVTWTDGQKGGAMRLVGDVFGYKGGL